MVRAGVLLLTLALGAFLPVDGGTAFAQEDENRPGINPFTSAVVKSYDGVFVGDRVRMKVRPVDGEFQGVITRAGTDLPFEARLREGRLEGRFTERAETYAFTARADGDTLQLEAGTFSATLRRVQASDFEGEYRSTKVRLRVYVEDGEFAGEIDFSGETYRFVGQLVEGALRGTFRDGETGHEFVLQPESGRTYSFKSGEFAQTVIKPQPGEITERERLETAELVVAERQAAEWEPFRNAYREIVKRPIEGMTFLRYELFASYSETREIAVYSHPATGLEFVLVPAGTYLMGDAEFEHTRPHAVTISKPFLLSRTECTQEAWDRFGIEGDERAFKGARLPIDSVTGEQVLAWCEAAGLRLPTEAEWELACRGDTTGRFNCGDDEAILFQHAWLSENSRRKTHDVARKRTNAFGLYDMHGNVSEWCLLAYDEDHLGSLVVDPISCTPEAPRFVFRGGNWQSFPREARSGFRFPWFESGAMSVLGFRPAMSVD